MFIEDRQRQRIFEQKVTHVDVSQNRGIPKWMVKIMENPIEMDDLGGTIILGNPHVLAVPAVARPPFALEGVLSLEPAPWLCRCTSA